MSNEGNVYIYVFIATHCSCIIYEQTIYICSYSFEMFSIISRIRPKQKYKLYIKTDVFNLVNGVYSYIYIRIRKYIYIEDRL